MPSRLPIPGQDDGTWGDILNAYLEVSLNGDGTLKSNIVGTNQLQNNAVTNAQLDGPTQATLASVAGKYTKPGSGIPKSDLASSVQTSLNSADSSLQSSQLGAANGIATLDSGSYLTSSQLPIAVGDVSTAYTTNSGSPYGVTLSSGVSIDLCRPPYNATAGSDITTALQNAVNAIATAGVSGEIFFSVPGTYLINGSPQTGTAFSYSYNGQILLPAVPNTASLAIRIRGCSPPNSGGEGRISQGGVVLQSNATSGYMFDAIPGMAASVWASSFGFTNLLVVFEDLILQLPSDPQCGGIKALVCMQLKMRNTHIQTSVHGVIQTLTGSLEGVVMPQVQNAGNIVLEGVEIRNIPMGIRLTEHALLNWVGIYYCNSAFGNGYGQNGGHCNYFNKVDLGNCTTIFMADQTVNSSVKVKGTIDWESPSITPGPFMNGPGGSTAFVGAIDFNESAPAANIGGLPLVFTDAPAGAALLGRLDIANTAYLGKAGWVNLHPQDNFQRALTPLTTGAPGLSWPTLHPWNLNAGSFRIVTSAGEGTLTSTNGTNPSVALVPAKNNGEPRSISMITTLASSACHVRLFANFVNGGTNTGSYIGFDIAGTTATLKINLTGGLTTVATATSAVTQGQTYTLACKVATNQAGVPKHIRCYINGTLVFDYELTSAQQSGLVLGGTLPLLPDAQPGVYDGLGLYEQNSTITSFSVIAASPDWYAEAAGTATLASGTSGSVANTNITANSLLRLTNIGASGTVGALSVALNAGTGFTINSTSGSDASKVYWEIVSY